MKNQEKLKIEYSLIEDDDFINSKSDVLEYLDGSIKAIEVSKNKEINQLRLDKIKKKINDVVTKLLIFEDNGFLDFCIENDLEKLNILDLFSSYLNQLKNKICDDNYLEIYKMAKFVDTNLILNINYLDEEFNILYYKVIGTTYFSNRDDISNNYKDFDIFFND